MCGGEDVSWMLRFGVVDLFAMVGMVNVDELREHV